MEVVEGQRVLIEGEFRLHGVPTDPTIVQLMISRPSGSLTVLDYPNEALIRREVGLFEGAVALDQPGQWHFRWQGVGVVDAVSETTVIVRPSIVLQYA